MQEPLEKILPNIPTSLPLKLEFIQSTLIPRLILNDEIKTALDNLYKLGSFVSTPLGESDLSSERMNQFLKINFCRRW